MSSFFAQKIGHVYEALKFSSTKFRLTSLVSDFTKECPHKKPNLAPCFLRAPYVTYFTSGWSFS